MSEMRKGFHRQAFHRHALALAALLACAAATAQVGTANLRGQLGAAGVPAQAGVEVVAVNTDTGRSYRTTSDASGGYQLIGLAPGSYEIRVGASA
jgi:hypothetical protein